MLLTRLLLLVALAIHLFYAALPLPLLSTEKSDALIPALLAVAPLFALAWLAAKYRHRPHRWAVVSLAVAAVQSLGATAAIVMHLRPTELHPALNLVVCLALWLPSTLIAWLAGRALLAQPADVLGTSPYQVEFPIRVVEKASDNTDSVVVTDRTVEIWIQRASSEPMELAPGQKRGRVPWKTLPLNDITGAAVRSAVPGEAPWAVLRNGPSQSVPAGEVAVVRFGDVEQVLPVENPVKFAELIRSRTGRALPSHVEQPVRELNAHVAEVLPAPEPVGPKVYPTRGPDDPLPTGPGLTVRWLVAAPVALVGIAGLPLALLLSTGATAGFLAWIGVVVVAWLCTLRAPRVWGRVALLPIPVSLMWLLLDRAWLFALALVLCPVLGRLAGAVFTNWRGTDLGHSSVEVPFALRNGGRLFVQGNRLLLEPQGRNVLPFALWLADIDLVQCGVREAPEPVRWDFPGVNGMVYNGTWLRIVAGPQQWLLGTGELRLVAELVKTRAASAAPAPPDDLDLAGWYRLRAWAMSKVTGLMRPGSTRGALGWRLSAAAIAGGFAFLLLPLAPARIPGVVAAVIALVALADWARIRPGLRRAELHPLPPGSPSWGEVRPDHAPVLGYQPWV
jgi:hypothetical protein